jgi:hypothetical protein
MAFSPIRLFADVVACSVELRGEPLTVLVWYLGEATETLDSKGRVTSREGSWEAGQDCEYVQSGCL